MKEKLELLKQKIIDKSGTAEDFNNNENAHEILQDFILELINILKD